MLIFKCLAADRFCLQTPPEKHLLLCAKLYLFFIVGMGRKIRCQRLRDASIRRKIKSRSVNPHNDDPP